LELINNRADVGCEREGEPKTFASTAAARRAGVAFVPESRRAMLFHQEPVYKNISISILDRISALLLKPARERSIAARQVEQLQIRPAAVELELGMLSGGNQQKVALAKWLSYPPRLLVLCEPTRGMDVGAKNDVINISSVTCAPRDWPLSCFRPSRRRCWPLADRILVLKRGAVVQRPAKEVVRRTACPKRPDGGRNAASGEGATVPGLGRPRSAA
jgi:ribose transport system ATP-binding protein